MRDYLEIRSCPQGLKGFNFKAQQSGDDGVSFMYRPAAPSRQPSLSLDSVEEEAIPCFELPADLQDYQGDPHDRKAMIGFRQIQQVS